MILSPARSEEHTSELQSRRDLVCRLLLDTASSEIYTLSLHDALPIYSSARYFEKAPLGNKGSGTGRAVTLGDLAALPSGNSGLHCVLDFWNASQALHFVRPNDFVAREIGRAHV